MSLAAWGLGAAGVACALVAIRVGEQGVARYGRRVPVTEMLRLGRKGDHAMLLGGAAGWLMAACFAAALVIA